MRKEYSYKREIFDSLLSPEDLINEIEKASRDGWKLIQIIPNYQWISKRIHQEYSCTDRTESLTKEECTLAIFEMEHVLDV